MSDNLQEIKEKNKARQNLIELTPSLYGVNERLLVNENSWLIEQLEQAQAANQKLVEAIESKIATLDKRIKRMDNPNPIHCDHSDRISILHGEAYIWEKALELAKETLSEVKGNG